MEPILSLRNLTKRYPGQGEYALGDEHGGVSLDVYPGELFALLGPSGCGKTTTLRIVGGFVEPSSGTVTLDGRDVTRVPPYRRPTNTVFQSYALFPHMSVGSNVAFGLTMAKVDRAERRRRASEALALVGLPGYDDRRVTELSGGQAQRAALARAIVNRPAVLLLDEPLGALDLRLRKQMQDEIARLKETTHTTFVHVTHDQEEACAIADRVAVMARGHIVQLDTPQQLYECPRTAYVAEFIDAGSLVRGRSRSRADVVEVDAEPLVLRGRRPAWLPDGAPVAAVIPPACVTLAPAGADAAGEGVAAVVERVTFTGEDFDVQVLIAGRVTLRASLSAAQLAALGGASERGAAVTARWRDEDVLFVEDDGELIEAAPGEQLAPVVSVADAA